MSDCPVLEDKALYDFYEKSGQNIVAEAKKAGVKHLLPLTIIGMDKLQGKPNKQINIKKK